jgi:hypothetical protein
MPGFSPRTTLEPPFFPVGAQWQWNERFEQVSGATPAALLAAQVAFRTNLENTTIKPSIIMVAPVFAVGGILYQTILYGFWTQITT